MKMIWEDRVEIKVASAETQEQINGRLTLYTLSTDVCVLPLLSLTVSSKPNLTGPSRESEHLSLTTFHQQLPFIQSASPQSRCCTRYNSKTKKIQVSNEDYLSSNQTADVFGIISVLFSWPILLSKCSLRLLLCGGTKGLIPDPSPGSFRFTAAPRQSDDCESLKVKRLRLRRDKDEPVPAQLPLPLSREGKGKREEIKSRRDRTKDAFTNRRMSEKQESGLFYYRLSNVSLFFCEIRLWSF